MPKSPYAVTKVAGELLCRAYAHRVPSTTILRLSSVYGPRQRPDLAFSKFASHIIDGQPIPVLGSTNSNRDYTFVQDVVTGLVASLGVEEPWSVFNLASGNPVTLEHMISTSRRRSAERSSDGSCPRIRAISLGPGPT